MEKLDDKTMKIAVLLALPWGALYFFAIRPWIIAVGGSWGPMLAALAVPVDGALLFIAVAVVAQILRKRKKS